MFDVHTPSFQLGMINCFAEMVAAGVKPLAISPPLTPAQYEEIAEGSEAIVEGFGIHAHLEHSLLVTHLQSPEFTRGKWSILYFKDPEVLRAYQALKERKASLGLGGDSGAMEAISREFMGLLGYPSSVIEVKIRGGDDPFLLVE